MIENFSTGDIVRILSVDEIWRNAGHTEERFGVTDFLCDNLYYFSQMVKHAGRICEINVIEGGYVLTDFETEEVVPYYWNDMMLAPADKPNKQPFDKEGFFRLLFGMR